MTIKDFLKRIFSIQVWGNCLGVVVAAFALATGALFFLQFYTHHGEAIRMPNVCGQDSEVALRKLKSLGLRAEIADTGYNKALSTGTILEQSIEAGREIKPGRLVALTINSAGSPAIALPDLADNCSLREAQTKLAAIGFRLAAPEYILGEKDWVYGVKVNGRAVGAGAQIPSGSAITLVVGNGETEEEFNGNDSLDYLLFTDEPESAVPDESIGYEEDATAPAPQGEAVEPQAEKRNGF